MEGLKRDFGEIKHELREVNQLLGILVNHWTSGNEGSAEQEQSDQEGKNVIWKEDEEEYEGIHFKLDFLWSDGDHFRGWVYKAERYFEIDKTNPELKVKLVLLHLGDWALEWQWTLMRNRSDRWPTREEDVESLEIIFRETTYSDPMAELTTGEQEESLQAYFRQFNISVSRVTLTNEYQISLFITRLKG